MPKYRIQIDRTESLSFTEECENLDAAEARAAELVDEVAAGDHGEGDFYTDWVDIINVDEED